MLLTKYLSYLLFLFLFSLSATALAHNKVVVVPLGGDDFKPLKNIVTVAKANGDFTNIQAAIDSISDASESNPYLVAIGPGTYNITSTINTKPHVHMTGSGEDATILSGNISLGSLATSAIISIKSDVSLSDFSVINAGGSGSLTIGIIANGSSSAQFENIHLEDLTIRISGSPLNSCRGAYIEYAGVVFDNVRVALDCTTSNYGIRPRLGANVIIRNSAISAFNGDTANRAVYSHSDSNTFIEYTRLNAFDTDSYGLYGPAKVWYSRLNGFTGGAYAPGFTSIDLYYSRIDKTAAGDGTINCTYVTGNGCTPA